MAKQEEIVIEGVLIDEESSLHFREVCRTCSIEEEAVIEMVSHGILSPKGTATHEWHFTMQDLERLQRAQRLQNDLEVNLPGVGLVLDLLDELADLHQKIARLEHQSNKF